MEQEREVVGRDNEWGESREREGARGESGARVESGVRECGNGARGKKVGYRVVYCVYEY